jgi:hypothetical protein
MLLYSSPGSIPDKNTLFSAALVQQVRFLSHILLRDLSMRSKIKSRMVKPHSEEPP